MMQIMYTNDSSNQKPCRILAIRKGIVKGIPRRNLSLMKFTVALQIDTSFKYVNYNQKRKELRGKQKHSNRYANKKQIPVETHFTF